MLLEKPRRPADRSPAGPPSGFAQDPEALIEEARRWERRRRYKRAGIALAVVAALLVAFGIARSAITGNGSSTLDSAALATYLNRSAASAGPLYGISRAYAANSTLAHVDPKTLAFVGKRLHVGEGFSPGGFSPDRSQLLLINELFPSKRARRSPLLAIVDLAPMRLDSNVQPRLSADLRGHRVAAATWPTPNRIVVLAARPQTRGFPLLNTAASQTLLAIDPRTGVIQWKRVLPKMGLAEGWGTVGTTTVLVFGSSNQHDLADATVMTVSPSGTLHSSVIRLAAGGYERRKVTVLPTGHKVTFLGRSFQERLITTAGSAPRAYVLTGGGEVYAIDPKTAKATMHVIPTPAGSPDTSPPDLLIDAAPLGSKLAVSAFFPRPNGTPRAGIYLIDPATWTARLVVANTPAWLTSTTTLVTFTDAGQFGESPAKWASKGTGIQIYDSNGTLRHHLEGTEAFNGIASTPLFDYAVIPTLPPSTTPPTNPAQHRAQQASIKTKEVLFEPATGKLLGTRTVTGQSPALIEPTADRPHR